MEKRTRLFLTPISTFWWLSMIIGSTLLVHWLQISWLWVFPFAFSLLGFHEIIVFWFFKRGLFPSGEKVQRSYQWFNFFLGEAGNIEKKGDLTEGYYNGDYTKTIEQATIDKYERVISYLKLKRGSRVLDVGCGMGDFLYYLKSKGIEGVGLTISPDQQASGVKRGLDIRVFDFRKELPPDLIGQFDGVTFFGCLEHFNESYLMKNRKESLPVFARAFESASKALSSTSESKRVFSTTLHVNTDYKWSLKDYFHGYLFHMHYSGLYPVEGDFEKASQKYFKVIDKYDASIDYQYSSIACPHHFGHFKVKWDVKKLFRAIYLFFVSPFALSAWLYHICDSWMWQFGGLEIVSALKRPSKTLWYVYEKI